MSLLDFKNVPGGQISGVNDEESKWISSETFDRYLYELSDDFVRSLEEQENDINPEVDEELKKIENESIPKSTMDQMKRTSNRFLNFLKVKKLSVEMEKIPKNYLNNYLRYFYSELRTLENKLYSPPSLVCIRAALHRYLQTIRNNVNIITQPDFDSSNKMLKAMVTKYKKSNQIKNEESYPAIELLGLISIIFRYPSFCFA